jgi:hypothetical protein
VLRFALSPTNNFPEIANKFFIANALNNLFRGEISHPVFLSQLPQYKLLCHLVNRFVLIGGFDNNGEQILGLGYQFQRRGARAVVASLWQVDDGGTQLLMNEFYNALQKGHSKTAALQTAQQALISGNFSSVGGERSQDGTIVLVDTDTGLPVNVSNNLNHPYYWASFILIGNGL